MSLSNEIEKLQHDLEVLKRTEVTPRLQELITQRSKAFREEVEILKRADEAHIATERLVRMFPTGEEEYRCRCCGHLLRPGRGHLCPPCKDDDE